MNRTGTYANQPNAVAAAEEAVRAGRVAVVLVVPVDHNNPGCGLGYEVWESQGYISAYVGGWTTPENTSVVYGGAL